MNPIYQVNCWNENFEGAKSRTYKNKTACQMPTKHGLGYKKLVRGPDGAALFGAWCAMIQVLSRHPAPRQGYCTDTGSADGNPYTPDDLEMLTDIPSKYFKKMLQVASSKDVGWLRIPDGYQTDITGSLDSDSDSDKRPIAAKPPRKRDSIMDALAMIECEDLSQVTKPAWSKHANARQIIMEVSPDVTPDEIKRRANNWKSHHPDCSCTSTAIASHWAKCDKSKQPTTTQPQKQYYESNGAQA
jgi:hypothetical protein